MTIKRIFTRAELEDLGLPYDGGDNVVSRWYVGKKRWGTMHNLVFRAEPEGPMWQVTYYRPEAEANECDTWGYSRWIDQVEAKQVEPYTVEVTRYRDVEG